MKRCLLIYFTGTFNTRYISKWLAQRLAKEGYEVTLYEIDPLKTEQLDYSEYDLVGFGAPIYGCALLSIKIPERQSMRMMHPLCSFCASCAGAG